MDLTALEHTIIALVCVVIGWACSDVFAGAAFGTALFIGREHAQAEQRVIQGSYDNRRSNMPWYGGFEIRAWNLSSLLDWLCPVAAVIIAAGIISYLK